MIGRLFPVGVPVSGKDMIDREKELKELMGLVEIGQSVVISSPRRFGKTSLAIVALDGLKKKGYFVGMVDLFKILNKRELAEKIVLSVLKNKVSSNAWAKLKEGIVSFLKYLKLKTSLGDFEIIVDLIGEKNEDKLLENALEFIEKFAVKNKKKIIFFFDEFSDIEKLDGDIWLKKMRSIFQHHKNATYIFAGSQESLMTSIFADRKQAFYKFARLTHLWYLPEGSTTEYISSSFKKLGFSFKREILGMLSKISQCHPYYVQLLCQNIFFKCINRKRIDPPDIEAAFIDSLLSEKSYFDELWQSLRGKKNFLKILEVISQGENPYLFEDLDKQAIYYILTQLENIGITKKIAENKHVIIDPFFSSYIKKRDEM